MIKLRAILRRRWPILLVTTLIGVIAGAVSASVGVERRTTQFQAEQVVVANRLLGTQVSVKQDALRVTRGEVPKKAAELLGDQGTASQLAAKVTTTADADSGSIRLLVYDTDPQVASEIVQAFTTSFLETVNADLRAEDNRRLTELQASVDAAQAALEKFDSENGFIVRGDAPLPQTETINALIAQRRQLADQLVAAQQRLEDTQIQTSRSDPYTTLGVEKPRVADAQLLEVPASPLFRSGLLGFIGLLLGIGIVLIVERVNQRIDTRDELAALLAVPIIAEIGSIPARKQPKEEDGRLKLEGLWSEHYRRVRSAIQFVGSQGAVSYSGNGNGSNGNGSNGNGANGHAGPPSKVVIAGPSAQVPGSVIAGHAQGSGKVPRVFLFVSALPGEGKSTSVALTAMALAEANVDTLVINADFRRPKIETYLGIGPGPSLADRAEMSLDRAELDDVVVPAHQPNLWVAAGGPPTHEVGARLEAAKELALEAAGRGGTVLIDSSPLRVSNDPIDLLSAVDEVVLVVRAGRSTVKSLEDTMELLQMHHAPVMGVVLIGTTGTREMYAYYASYYHQAVASDGPAVDPAPSDDQRVQSETADERPKANLR